MNFKTDLEYDPPSQKKKHSVHEYKENTFKTRKRFQKRGGKKSRFDNRTFHQENDF